MKMHCRCIQAGVARYNARYHQFGACRVHGFHASCRLQIDGTLHCTSQPRLRRLWVQSLTAPRSHLDYVICVVTSNSN